jgi:AraC family ethanolamine operon transcriptional activator
MSNKPLAPALAPKVFRFSDIDAFRSSVRNLNVDFTPLARTISAEQIILNLPGCDVNYTKSFPRITDAQLGPNCTAVGFSMDDGIPIRFNGVERDRAVIVIGGGGAVYSQVERAPREFASIVFTRVIEDRGWPQTGPNFKVLETAIAAQHALRELILQVTSLSPQFVDTFDVAAASAAITESLLAAVDNAFASVVNTPWATRANSTSKFKIFRQVQAALSDDITHPIYSAELAKQIGVSVRTMQDAVKQYRGMSLHRYLRLRRLWLVRKRLIEGSQSVKTCALAFGFWHLGEFSKSYHLQFGEAPSETLARSRYPSH